MATRTRTALAVLIWVALLGGCESEKIAEPPAEVIPVTLRLEPLIVTLRQGQSQKLIAVITGTTGTDVTWTTSNQSVATVNAGGTVTAVGIGTAVITGILQSDGRARAATTVLVEAPPVPLPPAPNGPTIVIQSVLQSGTAQHVNTNNVQGQINVVADFNNPGATAVQRVEFTLDGVPVTHCTQTFSAPGEISVAAMSSVPIGCSINTAAFDSVSGVTAYANGPRVLGARVLLSSGVIGAAATQALTLNNPSFFLANLTPSRTPAASGASPRGVATVGSVWQSGSITVKVVPVLFQRAAADSIASVIVTATTSGLGVHGAGNCVATGVSAAGVGTAAQDRTIAAQDGGGGLLGTNSGATPNCGPASALQVDSDRSNGFAVTFSEAASLGEGGVANLEDVLTFTLGSTTASGQAGPACVNPGTTVNPLPTCGSGVNNGSLANQIFLPGPWRHDNLAPRFTSLNINSANQYFSSQELSIGTGAAAAMSVIGARTVDYGVGRQTENGNSVFLAGTTLSATTALSSIATLPETSANSIYYLKASSKDALGNTRTSTATTNPFVVASAIGNVPAGANVAVQTFGIDRTAPTVSVNGSSPAENSFTTNPAAPGTFSLIASDAAGVSATPFTIKAELINSAGTTCYNLEAGGSLDCAVNGASFSSDGQFSLATGVSGYWRLTYVLTDIAGNSTAPVSRIRLVDGTFPGITPIAAPGTLVGGQPAAFSSGLFDNVELKDYLAYTGYIENGSTMRLEEPRSGLAAYGPDGLTTQSALTTTIASFIRSIESTGADAKPTAQVARATDFTYLARDQAGNETGQSASLLAAVIAGIGGNGVETGWGGAGRPFSAAINPVAAFRSTSALTTICVDTDADGCTSPTTAALAATANGPAGTFADPFARLSFYYRHPVTGRLVFLGNATSSFADVATTSTRTWSYLGVNFNAPPGFNGGTSFTIIALGIDQSGRALTSNTITIVQVVD